MASAPAVAFEEDAEGPWDLHGEMFKENPRAQLSEWEWDMHRLWCQYRGGGMGVGHLPESGGSGEQAAIMMDAFAVMGERQREIDELMKGQAE